jgi:hypothetical protein
MKIISALFAAATIVSVSYAMLTSATAQQSPAPAEAEKKGDGKVGGTINTDQRVFTPRDFRFSPTVEQVSKVDSLTVKQTAVTDDIGDARDYQREPGKMDIPNVGDNSAQPTTVTRGRPAPNIVLRPADKSGQDDDDND